MIFIIKCHIVPEIIYLKIPPLLSQQPLYRPVQTISLDEGELSGIRQEARMIMVFNAVPFFKPGDELTSLILIHIVFLTVELPFLPKFRVVYPVHDPPVSLSLFSAKHVVLPF